MSFIDIERPMALLGGLSAQQFMQRHWQREPLLVRQAIPHFRPKLSIADIRQIVRREEVESRLIWHDQKGWNMKTGPFARLPAVRTPGWTVLAQSMDLHDDGMAALMRQFRFVPDARLDDVMVSIASDGGGVGPHFDSYDVFLLQASGRRRWRISGQTDLVLQPGLPLKILENFRAEHEYVLEAGDMLYLPPRIAHDGVAEGDCMTISIGFRAPNMASLAQGMLHAASDQVMAHAGVGGGTYAVPPLPGPDLMQVYGDAGRPATPTPAEVPDGLLSAALDAIGQLRFDEALATRFLGQWLTELPANADFEPTGQGLDLAARVPATGSLIVDRCTRIMYRGDELFINGELAPVRASRSMRELADARRLDCATPDFQSLDAAEYSTLTDWLHEGWIHYSET